MSTPWLLTLLSLIIFYYIYETIVHPVFISPLSKIPNAHPIAPVSSLWILWKRYRKQENRAIYVAHEKHGSIVRLGPHELSVNCVDGGLRTIYGGGFEKPAWYPNQFLCYGLPSMFSMIDRKPHSVRKRMVSNIYSKSYVQSSQDMAKLSEEIIFDRLFPILESLATEGTPVDVLELSLAAAMDFVSAYLVGLSNATNFLEDLNMHREFLIWFQSRRPYNFWHAELPKITSFLTAFGINVVPQWVEKRGQQIESFCLTMCNAAEACLSAGHSKQDSSTDPVVYRHLAQSISAPIAEESSYVPQKLAIPCEILDHLGAGHETSGIALTYCIYEISQRPTLQHAIRSELLSLSPPLKYPTTAQSLPSPRSIDNLPLLHATLMETLRLHASIPGPQPRVTPPIPTSLANSPPLPAGIRVSANAYCLHRNKEVFPDPTEWRPERWLTESKERKDEMMRWFWAFSSGSRMCIGSNFAVQELKLLLTAIYTNYTTAIVDDSGIAQEDNYTAYPSGNSLVVRFSRV